MSTGLSRGVTARWARALRRSDRGQALVEFAVSAPLLLTFVFGTIEIGHAANAYLTVLGSARDAARLGVGGGTDTELRSLVTVETAGLPVAIPTSCTAGAAGMCITRGSVPGPSSVKMEVCYSHALIVGFPGLLSNPLLLCSATTMRVLS